LKKNEDLFETKAKLQKKEGALTEAKAELTKINDLTNLSTKLRAQVLENGLAPIE